MDVSSVCAFPPREPLNSKKVTKALFRMKGCLTSWPLGSAMCRKLSEGVAGMPKLPCPKGPFHNPAVWFLNRCPERAEWDPDTPTDVGELFIDAWYPGELGLLAHDHPTADGCPVILLICRECLSEDLLDHRTRIAPPKLGNKIGMARTKNPANSCKCVTKQKEVFFGRNHLQRALLCHYRRHHGIT